MELTEPLDFIPYPTVIQHRAFQRRLNIHVQPNGTVKVTASKTTSRKKISDFLNKHDDWIQNHLHRYRELRQNYPPKKYTERELFLWKGHPIPLTFACTSNKSPHFKVHNNGGPLTLFLPNRNVSFEEITKIMRTFYEKEGRKQLMQSVKFFSEKMNLYPTALSFRSQKTRWGSCSSVGHISLNWRLIAALEECLNYVVIHELAHLKHQNHSQRFWNLVATQDTNWKSHRKWLKDHQYAFDFLAKQSELHPPSEFTEFIESD